jgi:ATP-dependent DNA helicase DinG
VLRDAAREFYLPIKERIRAETGRQRFDPPERDGVDVEAEWAVLSQALDEVAMASDEIAPRAHELKETLDLVLERNAPGYVYGVEARGRGNVVLQASPIEIAGLLESTLFDRLHACVLTSATLSVGGSFDFFRKRLGLPGAETLIVGSPFDYERQAVLYLPKGMPEPRDPAFFPRAIDEIEALLEITDGRAFLLFTSHAALGRARQALEAKGRYRLFVQGEGSKAALLEGFKATPRSVLLGTSSFWHGVDVPGAALSLVVIDKLPFDVPSDPIVAARIERIREDEGNPFAEYQTPMAVLDLKQGLGRLLRSKGDRGILSVLDPRLTTKGYGKTFLASLPPYPVVRSREEASEFFGRGACA